MDADLLVELPGYRPCAVRRSEFMLLLATKGWQPADPEIWTAPCGSEPDAAFTYLAQSLIPRQVARPDDDHAVPHADLPVFCRRHERGADVWMIREAPVPA